MKLIVSILRKFTIKKFTRKHTFTLVIALLLSPLAWLNAQEKPFRPPSVPLVAYDPMFNIWSGADRLTDVETTYYDGSPRPLTSLVSIDGQAYRLMGDLPADVEPLEQTSVKVLPTQSIYQFRGRGVKLTLTFMTPALPDDLSVYSRPVTYITWTVQSVDGKQHKATVYFASSYGIEGNEGVEKVKGLNTLRLGKEVSRDRMKIDSGCLYISTPQEGAEASFGSSRDWLLKFPVKGQPQVSSDIRLAEVTFKTFTTTGEKPSSCWLMLAYDEAYSIQYFSKLLSPYWRKDGARVIDLLAVAAKDYESLSKRCAAFDEELMTDLRKSGGEKYACICALAYRQCVAGNGLVADSKGQPLLFTKENTSGNYIGTVDVICPMLPQFLLLSPSLAKASLVPILNYAVSSRWKHPNPPHDLGIYPRAMGQDYGGGEEQSGGMPVEESGNMIIMLAALAQVEGNADFAGKYWAAISQWAAYLKDKGIDPENQLCTDDFMGPSARNVNLSAKTIVALGAYSQLCEMRGEHAKAREYLDLARKSTLWWVKKADDGDHFRLGFDMKGTWSQKYNLVWDRILGLNLFPMAALRKEMDFYKKTMDPHGLALDYRQSLAKIDGTLFTATLTGEKADFDALLDPVYQQLDETTSFRNYEKLGVRPGRWPLNDVYHSNDGVGGWMFARPVIGGVFIKMLYDKALWKKWASADKVKAGDWASFPEEK